METSPVNEELLPSSSNAVVKYKGKVELNNTILTDESWSEAFRFSMYFYQDVEGSTTVLEDLLKCIHSYLQQSGILKIPSLREAWMESIEKSTGIAFKNNWYCMPY